MKLGSVRQSISLLGKCVFSLTLGSPALVHSSRLFTSVTVSGSAVTNTCQIWSQCYFRQFTKMADDDTMRGLDETQIKLMAEECILVDENDKNIGSASKKVCHRLENINKGMLHRAFSVFLFNTKGELLLQQRADAKITFPAHWTNTCCSHPLNTPLELEETQAVGVLRAAQRKLKHELGIEAKQVPIDNFSYLTRIHYKSANVPADGIWGEHEIDYVLITQGEVDVVANDNEVQAYKYVSQADLRQLLDDAEQKKTLVTPWFSLIAKTFLFKWWDNLERLKEVEDQKTIHRM